MNLFRKFFDIDAPVAAPPSIASLMATQGVLNTMDSPIAKPIELNKEQVKPPAPQESEPAVSATSNSTNAETVSETPTPEKVEIPNVVAPIEPPKVEVQPTWQEVLKQQPDTVLKEVLGGNETLVGFVKSLKEVDPKMVSFLNHWQTNNGNVTDYLRELSTDYEKMPAEEVMRHQLRKEYPRAAENNDQLDALYQTEIVERYKLDPEVYTEQEVLRGKMILEAKADKFRDDLIKNQQQFLIPKPPEPKAVVPDNTAQLQQQEFEAYSQKINGTQYVKNLLQNKALSLSDADGVPFNYPIPNADAIVNNLLNVIGTYISAGKLSKEDFGKYNDELIENQILTGAFSANPKQFLKEYAIHLKSLGAKQALDELEHVKPPTLSSPSTTEIRPKSPAEAAAKSGRLVTNPSY